MFYKHQMKMYNFFYIIQYKNSIYNSNIVEYTYYMYNILYK